MVASVDEELTKHGLVTSPHFNSVWIDAEVNFERLTVSKNKGSEADDEGEQPAVGSEIDSANTIGRLPSARTTLVTVAPDTPINEATTLMLQHDYSQLPVFSGTQTLRGVISWTTIGKSLALGRKCESVKDCMVDARTVTPETSLFVAIGDIVSHEYVLVQESGSSRRIAGIVTTSDLSLQFRLLAEPFLLLGEIENYVRALIGDKFSIDDIQKAADSRDETRVVESISDLSFGEYLRLIENPDNWAKLGIAIDRKVTLEGLERVRRIRNDVMHFDPDGIDDADLELLREVRRMFWELRALKAF